MLIFPLAKGNLEPAKSNWQGKAKSRQKAISKVDFPDLWFGSVNTTSRNQHRVQRSLYSDQTEIYIQGISQRLYNMNVKSLYGNE